MNRQFKQQYEICREAILIAIIDAIQERSDYIRAIERTPRGDVPVNGIALEIFPWHNFPLGLSLRLCADLSRGEFRYNSADWSHFEFTNGCRSPSIEVATSLITEIYIQGKQSTYELTDMAHLTFMAGADALLNPSVAHLLNEFGIDAPEITNEFVPSPFEYIVVDSDKTIAANYCDIVLANRVTRRLFGK